MRLLALDIATTTGFAVDRPAGSNTPGPMTGTFTCRGGGFRQGAAGHSFGNWLHKVIAHFNVEALVFEAPLLGGSAIVMNKQTARLLIGLAFVAETCAYGRKIPVFEANVQTVRRHFVGHGRPKNPKQAVMERCRILGWEFRNHDEADAAAVWAYTKACRDKSFRLESATPMFARAG